MRSYTYIPLWSVLVAVLSLTACKNPDQHTGHGTEVSRQAEADSLMADVMDGHDAGMAKYGKLKAMEQKVRAAADSLATLPLSDRQRTASRKSELDAVAGQLRSAIEAMDRWMETFQMDSAMNDLEKRVRYLTAEKHQVNRVKEDILNSLARADSLLKAGY
ncbi:MAG: hypothetical protein RJA57_670 [Bacteroidota bacterium]